MTNLSGQPEQGTDSQRRNLANIPLRPDEEVLLVTRWDGGWANSVGVFLFLGIVSIACLLSGKDIGVFVGLVFGAATLIKLMLEILSRLNGRAVLTSQRIAVRGLPNPFVQNEVELKDVQDLKAGTDLIRVGGGMSTMTIVTRAGKKRRIVVAHASSIVEAYQRLSP